MRFYTDGPAIPDILLERCDGGRVVFLCGAGVSFQSRMPSFVELTRHVIEFFDPSDDSEIMTAFQPWLAEQSAANVPLDQIFNLLHQEYGKDEVNALVTERLRVPNRAGKFGREHGLIKRISSNRSGVPQVVTTNFDLLFEAGPEGKKLDRHVPPALPDLSFGSSIEGITYLHGRLVELGSAHPQYVLSSADFGRAYLSEGWATNFVRNLLEKYTVVLVGYQAEDPPIKYLLQGLNHDGQYDRSRLYAFDRGLPEAIEAKWRDRGVTAIAYPDHRDLWKAMEAWADRADDPRRWRETIITKRQQDPKELAPHQRGQVAHVLRTVQGARLFSEADPAPHPEWVCVMDANVRSAQERSGFGDDAETFDPRAVYGLDDDLDISEGDRNQGVSNDNLLVWRDGDDNPHQFHRLGGQPAEGFEPIPIRLGHLITWISQSIDNPVLAWWAIRQNGLHPRLLEQISWQVERSDLLHERARRIWNLILEHHRDRRNRGWDGRWFDLKRRVAREGWTVSVLRDFRRVATPRVLISPPIGLAESKPPSLPWNKIRRSDLGRFDVKFLDPQGGNLEVPDEVLPQVFDILEEQLAIASGLLADIETGYFRTPSCYRGREVNGREHITKAGEVMIWFVQLFDRLAVQSPELAAAHATTWPATDQFFFRKLKLYALSKVDAFGANRAAEEVLAFDQEAFWDSKVARELLFLLADRWKEFSQENRDQLAGRILAGPGPRSYWSDEEFPTRRDEVAAGYARYLELQGCELTAAHGKRLAEMIAATPEWSDRWATSTVAERGSRSGFVGIDETPDAVMHIPVSEVVSRATEVSGRDIENFTERQPFTGLVKTNPRKALSALTIAGKAGNYPQALWSSMIDNLPDEIPPRLRTVFLHRLARLPYGTVAELGHTLGQWLEQNFVAALEFDNELAWKAYDHIADGILSDGANAAESGLGEVRRGGKVIERSRRTYEHASSGPIGVCTTALFHAASREKREAGSLIPKHIKSRVERFFAVPGQGSDHAVSITTSNLNWIMYVDPDWTQKRLIPMLAFDHPASEPAWNGFLHSGRPPWSPVAEIIKPLMLDLFPWLEGLSWDRSLLEVAASWLGAMRLFQPDEAGGLTQGEMRSVLRSMSDETRNRVLFWLGRVGQDIEEGWTKHVIPFIDRDWPRERRYRTSASTRAWIGLLEDTDDRFPTVYEAAKNFLVPVEGNDHPFYRFTEEMGEKKSLTAKFPETALDLMNRVTPQFLTCPPYELPNVLAVIAETDPALTSDPRYLRLIDLVERS